MGYIAFFILALFFLIGILLNRFYAGREFDDGNTIILEFAASVGAPGLLGLITAAIVAAAMSSLDSSLNSMATVTTVDFYEKFVKANGSPQHYLAASRLFTLMWGLIIVIPAIVFMDSDGSVLEVLSKVGSFFVGAKLAAYGLGFYSKHTCERGLLIGIVAGFLCLWWVEVQSDVAWPWYCAIGGVVSIAVAWAASILLEGFKPEHHPFTVQGQRLVFQRENKPESLDGWYQLPGKVDPSSYWLLAFFALSLVMLWAFAAAT